MPGPVTASMVQVPIRRKRPIDNRMDESFHHLGALLLQTWMQLLMSFFGGGLLSALITAFRANRAEVNTRRLTYLEIQLQKVYGPVYLRLLETRRLINLYLRYREAWDHVTSQSRDLDRSTILGEMAEEDGRETRKIIKEILVEIQSNNKTTLAILREHPAYLDASDMELVLDIFEDVVRQNLEMADEPDKTRVTGPVLDRIGEEHVLRENVYLRFEERFADKKRLLNALIGAP